MYKSINEHMYEPSLPSSHPGKCGGPSHAKCVRLGISGSNQVSSVTMGYVRRIMSHAYLRFHVMESFV